MKKYPDTKYAKCRKCRRELPCDGFIDGLCNDCVAEKHYCEDCEFCALSDRKDPDEALEWAKCTVAPKDSDSAKLTMLAKRFDNQPIQYYYCTSERTDDQCENFKFHEGA
jgi:uncharacterized protein YlaI